MVFVESLEAAHECRDIRLVTDNILRAINCFTSTNANCIHMWHDNKEVRSYFSEDKNEEILNDIVKFALPYINKKDLNCAKLQIQDEDCLLVKDLKGDEVLHIEYDYTVSDIVDEVVEFVKYINERS